MTGQPSDHSELTGLRAALEAWEQEAAALWDGFIRSPSVLRRIGQQLDESMRTARHVESELRLAAIRAIDPHEAARQQFALEQLETQLAALAARLDRLERLLNNV